MAKSDMTEHLKAGMPEEITCYYCDNNGWYVGANYHTGEAEQIQCEACDAWHIISADLVEKVKEQQK